MPNSFLRLSLVFVLIVFFLISIHAFILKTYQKHSSNTHIYIHIHMGNQNLKVGGPKPPGDVFVVEDGDLKAEVLLHVFDHENEVRQFDAKSFVRVRRACDVTVVMVVVCVCV